MFDGKKGMKIHSSTSPPLYSYPSSVSPPTAKLHPIPITRITPRSKIFESESRSRAQSLRTPDGGRILTQCIEESEPDYDLAYKTRTNSVSSGSGRGDTEEHTPRSRNTLRSESLSPVQHRRVSYDDRKPGSQRGPKRRRYSEGSSFIGVAHSSPDGLKRQWSSPTVTIGARKHQGMSLSPPKRRLQNLSVQKKRKSVSLLRTVKPPLLGVSTDRISPTGIHTPAGEPQVNFEPVGNSGLTPEKMNHPLAASNPRLGDRLFVLYDHVDKVLLLSRICQVCQR